MPAKTVKQRKAAGVACHGKSKIGMTKKAGCEILHGKKKSTKRRKGY